jgi:translation elongation factor EF-Tu-like GTPase
MQPRPPDFRARVRFLSQEEGGRKSPVFQGYRPDLAYKEGAFELFMIWPRFLDDALKEREEKTAVPNLSLADFYIVNQRLKEEVHRQRIKPGTELWVCEGQKKVAEVVVTDLLEGLK